MTFPSPAEEAGSPVEELVPQKEWPTTVQAPNHFEKVSEPKKASSLGVMAIAQRWLPPAPPEFREPWDAKSELSPLENAGSLLGIPWGTWLDLSSLGSMQVVITQNTLMEEL